MAPEALPVFAHLPVPIQMKTSLKDFAYEQKESIEEEGVRGIVAYQTPPEDPHAALYRYLFQDPPEGKALTNSRPIRHELKFTDMRPLAGQFSLEKQGFQLHKIKAPSGVDWENPEDIQAKYYPVVEETLKSITKASRVHVFDQAVRYGKVESSKILQKSVTVGEPLPHCHVDFTARGGVERLEQVLPGEAERLKKTPFAIIQIWRPLVGPVKSSPLGLVDASTIDKEDYLENRLILPDRVWNTYHVKYNPNHRWYYAKDMMPDEAYVFVNFDSRMDRARFVGHAAFQDLTIGQGVSDRRSVEARAFVFWEDLPEQPCSATL